MNEYQKQLLDNAVCEGERLHIMRMICKVPLKELALHYGVTPQRVMTIENSINLNEEVVARYEVALAASTPSKVRGGTDLVQWAILAASRKSISQISRDTGYSRMTIYRKFEEYDLMKLREQGIRYKPKKRARRKKRTSNGAS